MTPGLFSVSSLASPPEVKDKLTQKEEVGVGDIHILRPETELKPVEDCADLRILKDLKSTRLLPPADIFDLGNSRILRSRRVLPPTDGTGLQNLRIFEKSVEKTSTRMGKGPDVSFTRDEIKEGSEDDIVEFSRLLKPVKGNKILPYRGYKLQDLDIEFPLKTEKLQMNDDQGFCSEVYKFLHNDKIYIAKYVDLLTFRYAEVVVPIRYHQWLKQHGNHQPQDGLAKIFAVYVEETYVVIVQEYAGVTVEKLFMDRNFDDVALRSVIEQGLRILQQLHGIGISLGDIKAANIVIKDGVMKFIDYGSSSISVDPNYSTNLSLVYRAPEYIQNIHERLSPVGDIFAFGVTVISLVTGASEWQAYKRQWEEDENWDELSREQSLFKLLEQCRPVLQDLLRNMLIQQPKSRLTAEQALEHKYFKETKTPPVFDPVDTLWSATEREFPESTELGQGDTDRLRGATEMVSEEKVEQQLINDKQQTSQVSELRKKPNHVTDTGASLLIVPTLVEEKGQHEANLSIQPCKGQLYERRTTGMDHPSVQTNVEGLQMHQHDMVDQPARGQQQPENHPEDLSCGESGAVLVPTTVEEIGEFKLAIGDQPPPGQCQPDLDPEGSTDEGTGALQVPTTLEMVEDLKLPVFDQLHPGQCQLEQDPEGSASEGVGALQVPTTLEMVEDLKLPVFDQLHPGQCQLEQDPEGSAIERAGALQVPTTLDKEEEFKLSTSNQTHLGQLQLKQNLIDSTSETASALLLPASMQENGQSMLAFGDQPHAQHQTDKDPEDTTCGGADEATPWFEVPDNITGKVWVPKTKSPLCFIIKWAKGCHVFGEFTLPKLSRVIYRKDFPDGSFCMSYFQLKQDTSAKGCFKDTQGIFNKDKVFNLAPPDRRLACSLNLDQGITIQLVFRCPDKPVYSRQEHLESPISGHFVICVSP